MEEAILKGAKKRDVRAGLVLPPVDFEANIATLNAKWSTEDTGFAGDAITPEQAMSSLMYPQVFADYMKRRKAKGRALRYLPTPVYFYAMAPGQSFEMTIPSGISADVLKIAPENAHDEVVVTVELRRVCPLKEGKRKVIFAVNGREQHFDVKDNTGAFVFEGEMADPKNLDQIASPMPGLVEKMLVVQGQTVSAGDTLCTISAMKMEVKVTASKTGTGIVYIVLYILFFKHVYVSFQLQLCQFKLARELWNGRFCSPLSKCSFCIAQSTSCSMPKLKYAFVTALKN